MNKLNIELPLRNKVREVLKLQFEGSKVIDFETVRIADTSSELESIGSGYHSYRPNPDIKISPSGYYVSEFQLSPEINNAVNSIIDCSELSEFEKFCSHLFKVNMEISGGTYHSKKFKAGKTSRTA